MKRKLISWRLNIHLGKWYFKKEVVGKETKSVIETHYLCFSWFVVTTNEHVITRDNIPDIGTTAVLLEVNTSGYSMEQLSNINDLINNQVRIKHHGIGAWIIYSPENGYDESVSLHRIYLHFGYKIRVIDQVNS